MPYIKKKDREQFLALNELVILTPGELNYNITMLLKNYLAYHEHSYTTINDIMGALEGAKAEFYRRVAVPYEIKKCEENEDVY
jgi:hypothetical protein